jgi:hypothetical protein
MSDTFDAFDADGNRFVVHIRRSYLNTDTLAGPGKPIEGLRSYHLSTGGALNRIDDETFEIVATGRRVTTRRP